MDPFWGTRSLALGTEVGAHFGRQDGPNLGARSPFYESAFRGAWGGNAGSHPSLVWVLGCGVGWGNGGRLFRIGHFQSKLGSHPWVGQPCVSLLQSSFGVKVLVGGVLRRCARSSRQGRWRVRRSIFLSRALFKHGHTPCNGQDPRVFNHIFGAQNENHKVYGITKLAGVDTVLMLSVCRRLAASF